VKEITLEREKKGITPDGIFQSFSKLCKSIHSVFPQGPIIYLGCSRTWLFGPKRAAFLPRRNAFPTVRFGQQSRRENPLQWASRHKSTEGRKRQCLRVKSFVLALPVYRLLRVKFLKIIQKNCVPKYPSKACGGLKGVFFNDVFAGMTESHIFDQWGHLSKSGFEFLVQNLYKQVSYSSIQKISFF